MQGLGDWGFPQKFKKSRMVRDDTLTIFDLFKNSIWVPKCYACQKKRGRAPQSRNSRTEVMIFEKWRKTETDDSEKNPFDGGGSSVYFN